MLQEGTVAQPIDYRDVIIPYDDPKNIPLYVENIVRSTAETVQSIGAVHSTILKGLLERIDLGDVAAENEIQALAAYFVRTPQFQQARQGHARLVIGRKGSGKTAIFYGIRTPFHARKGKLVLDLKPEGHQFTRLREMVLTKLSGGLQEHTLTAFWHFLLILELANKLIEREATHAWRNADSLEAFKELKKLYDKHPATEGDFSERLMGLVNRLIDQFPKDVPTDAISSELTRSIYSGDINVLNDTVVQHLEGSDGVWILFDNLDKGFPSHGLHKEDVLILRCLLEATRKLQRSLEKKGVECASTVFLRRDVFDHLIDETPDRGKESFANLDWSDMELNKELLLKRFRHEVPELTGSFEDVWSHVFDPHVGGESSFSYITLRTFLRPRDILNFARKCIQVAVSRGHTRVEQDDIRTAEDQFSEDMLNELRYEMRDIFPDHPDLLLHFLGMSGRISRDDVDLVLMDAAVPDDEFEGVCDSLLWFGFLGMCHQDEEHYSYQVNYNVPKLKAFALSSTAKDKIYVIHPAFRRALSV